MNTTEMSREQEDANLVAWTLRTPDWNGTFGSYAQIVDSFGVNIVAAISIGDDQGDELYLIELNDDYGLLTVGYGSCSGCDALQGDESPDGHAKLRREMWRSIDWRGSALDTLTWWRARDWAGQFYGSSVELDDFLKRGREALTLAIARERV
jgi:hypothetical protein